MFSSYRTTITGVIAILSGLAAIGTALVQQDGPDMQAVGAGIAGVVTGIGLLCARDNKVTSEQAGAGK